MSSLDNIQVTISGIIDPVLHLEPVYLGFDTKDYEGDKAMQAWWEYSPYWFLGYYLDSPCHRKFKSYTGSWTTLRDMGWGLAILYVGQQVPQPGGGGCSNNNVTAAQGTKDGVDTIYLCQEIEKFPSGTVVFLDIE